MAKENRLVITHTQKSFYLNVPDKKKLKRRVKQSERILPYSNTSIEKQPYSRVSCLLKIIVVEDIYVVNILKYFEKTDHYFQDPLPLLLRSSRRAR